MEIGYDNEKYIELQSEKIKERIDSFGGKLYLEFGGKLFDDFHASRVLPGFLPDSKLLMLLKLKDKVEVVITISANDIEQNKIRGDLGITYDQDLLRLIDAFRSVGLYVGSVVITHFNGQQVAVRFKELLAENNIRAYYTYVIAGYPNNVEYIVSEDGFGKNDYVETSRELVVVTAPGPGSGKMATCLSQLYHDSKRGIKAGYAKFETFPIFNLPLHHPVNLAYEAATADLNDVNMIDPFHMEAYGKLAVSYNRDVEAFPVLNEIFKRLLGESPYKSPTDMGVNMVGYCITDMDIVTKAAFAEIIRRYYDAMCSLRKGMGNAASVAKIETLMKQAQISTDERPVIKAALDLANDTGAPTNAIQLNDGTIVTGKTSSLLGASSAALLNALKALGGIPKEVHLIDPSIIEPIQHLKVDYLKNNNPRLHTDEVLIALCICASFSEVAKTALNQLGKLKDCQAHSSVILSQVDEKLFKKLGILVTSEPKYQTHKLYHKA
ncbi:MAG: DUF1846 domain-containing protein [Clostridia bacterium]|nr:DUF1846 domain-containing protein [Clostridia bacterium]